MDVCERNWWDWRSDLATDIHDTLKAKENTMMRLRGGSKLMYWRRYLVDWLALTCQKYRLNSNAQHLAVCLYDRFTDQCDLPVGEHKMLVLCCLLVASKYEEREEKIPKFKVVVEDQKWNMNANDYLRMEIRLLSCFEWNIGFPTASHFKEYYMQVALSDRDMLSGQPIVYREQTFMYLEKNVNYFLEVSLQDQGFLVYKPSLITASCIAAARVSLHISPTWTVELNRATCFSWHHLVPCIEILLRLYEDDRKVDMKVKQACSSLSSSSGYSTSPHSLNSSGGTPAVSPVATCNHHPPPPAHSHHQQLHYDVDATTTGSLAVPTVVGHVHGVPFPVSYHTWSKEF